MAAHAVGHRVHTGEHLPNLLQRHAQLTHELDAPEGVHFAAAVIPVAVFAVAAGAQQPLRLVKADVLFGDAHQGLYLVDLQRRALLSVRMVYLPEGGKSRGI